MFSKIVITLLLFSSSAWAQKSFTANYCQKQSLEEIAKQAIKREMLGASLSYKFKCLSDKNLKYHNPIWNPPVEGDRVFDVGVDLRSLKIKKLELVDEFTGQYSVSFEIKSTKDFGEKVHEDTILIATKLSDSMHKQYGCSHTMQSPEKYFLASICYKAKKEKK
ncbi:MAG: hypothetical protein CME71_01530 [Halobacteriovorax sp.]|nr:hypothetical protein [Halobacteriovorax sp.]